MNSSKSKHPKKKRRIEGDQEPLPGPSSASLPLVSPHLVVKSSKDPNRGMYPHTKRKPNRSNRESSPDFVKASCLVAKNHQDAKAVALVGSSNRESSPDFVKASCLVAKNHQDVKAVALVGSSNRESSPDFVKASCLVAKNHQDVKAVALVGSSDEDEPSPEQVLSNANKPSTSKTNCDSTRPRKRLLNNFTSYKKRKANIPSRNSTKKITGYFKPSNSSQSVNNRTDPAANKTRIMRLKNHHTTETYSWSQKWQMKNDQLLDSITDNEQFFKQRDCYGLVENSEPEEMGEDYFKNLPTHIIESILCQIPMLDLLSCRLVCSRWLDIIDNPKFMEWKKNYYRYKKQSSRRGLADELRIQRLLQQFEYKDVEDCIGAILKFMGKTFNRIPCSEMYSLLIQSQHGELADHVLAERFPEWNAKESRVWCQFALAVILCETVWDVLNVYKSLFTSKSCCLRPDVNDAMYSIATFLLYFRTVDRITCGFHYRVYYALYLIENSIPLCQRERVRLPNIPGQQSLHKYSNTESSSLTYEQIRILNHNFDLNQKIRIIALAGTGKTTTLIHLARLYPQIKFLNLVFNKAVSDESKKRFPENVTCKTAHSLAYSAVGWTLRDKVTPNLRPHDLIGYLSHNEEHIQIYAYASLVLLTINNYVVSASLDMSLVHVPVLDFNRKTISKANRDRILMDAYKIWTKMIDASSTFKITHDAYLKVYHMRRPKLDKYQCIMVDEAQDCSPVILDIVLSQSMPVLFVGDPHQQIYGFRGAQNALQGIKATHTYYLTKSFRFGPQISYIASCILEILQNVTTNTLVGNTSDSNLCGDTSGQFAIIARSNLVLFNEALRMIVFKRLKPYEPTVIHAAFAGGIDTYGFDQISDIYRLKLAPKGQKQLQDKFISRFKTYSDLLSYARYSNDIDLISKIEIVNQHEHDILKFITILKEKCSSPMEVANVVFSTAHKSKGLEFDTVSLTDDYPISIVPGFLECQSAREEANTLYVAITRAKKCLLLPEKMSKILHLAHEKFEYPLSAKDLLKSSPELKCVACSAAFVPHTVLVNYRRKYVMASGREISEGPLCMKCGSDPFMRPDVHMNNLVMYLDPTRDNYHRFTWYLCGPLPDDPPIRHDSFSEFDNADRVFVINLNIH